MNHQIMTDIMLRLGEKIGTSLLIVCYSFSFQRVLIVGDRKVVISELPVTVYLFRGSRRKCEREVLQRCPALTAYALCNKV